MIVYFRNSHLKNTLTFHRFFEPTDAVISADASRSLVACLRVVIQMRMFWGRDASECWYLTGDGV